MKYISQFFILIAVCALFSCSASQKITVTGQPGTRIYTPDMRQNWTINETGNVKVKLSKKCYYAYMLSQDNRENTLIPFAIDYKYKNYDKLPNSLMIGGLSAAVASLCLTGQEILQAAVGLSGAYAFLTGLYISDPLIGEKIRKEYKFKYLDSQQTNQDILFTKFIDTGFRKETAYSGINTPANITPAKGATTVARARNKQVANKNNTSSAFSASSTASRSISNYGRIIEGTYTGTGKLMQESEVIETYNDMILILKRVDKDNVMVEVHESGLPFFNSAGKYSIKKDDSNKFTLTLDGIPSATITIDKGNQLVYFNPKVNIDKEVYTLKITAIKR